MAVIGELAVNVVAKTDKLTKGLAKARKQVSGVAKSFQTATRGITNFTSAALGIGGGLGIIGVAASMRSAAESIDKLAKTSQKLGITTEALAGLHVAAERTGVEVRTLDMGIQRMVRRVSEAAQGTGEAKDALVELGLSAQTLNRLSPEKTFARIAESMKRFSQADQVRLSMRLFDSEGVALVNTLKLGSQGLREMQEEAVRLGRAISGEDAKKVEEFTDQVGRLKDLTGNLGRTITIAIAPEVTKFFEGVEHLLAPKKTSKGKFDRAPLSGVEPEGFFGPLGRAVENHRRRQYGEAPITRTDIHTQGVPLRPGEVMNPRQARELVTVNQEQLRSARALDDKMAQLIDEYRKTYSKGVDPFDVTELTIP